MQLGHSQNVSVVAPRAHILGVVAPRAHIVKNFRNHHCQGSYGKYKEFQPEIPNLHIFFHFQHPFKGSNVVCPGGMCPLSTFLIRYRRAPPFNRKAAKHKLPYQNTKLYFNQSEIKKSRIIKTKNETEDPNTKL